MRRLFILALAAWGAVDRVDARTPPEVVVTGLTNPESVAVNAQGQVFASVVGEFNRDGDGAVLKIERGKAEPFASGLDDPKGIAAYQQWLFVADKTRVLRIDAKGKAEVFAAASAFPKPPLFLNDVAVDVESGALFVSDSGDLKGGEGAVFRISPRGEASLVVDKGRLPELHTPNGVLLDGASHLLLGNFGTGALYRIKLADGSVEKLAEGLGTVDGLAWDQFGRLFVTDNRAGRVFASPRAATGFVPMVEGLKSAADLAVEPAEEVHVGPRESPGEPGADDRIAVGLMARQDAGRRDRVAGRD